MPRPLLSTGFPESTAIDLAVYDPDRAVLDIWYSGGDRYSYFDVPVETYEQLCAAASAGEFVNQSIKPRFDFVIDKRRRRFRPRD